MNCIITGGAGFIGSHLTRALRDDGHEVRVIDRSYGDDILGPLDFAGAKWVFHLAALADIVPSVERPLEYHRVNVDGTVNVLEASRRAGVKRLVYAASSSCYGIPDEYPTPETAPLRPMYPYALTKVVAEQYVLHWGHVYGLPVVSLRLFNVYGPGMRRASNAYGGVLKTWLGQRAHGLPLTVVGDGNQTRDFVHVSDVVRAFILAVESSVTGEAINIGGGNPRSINQLAVLVGGVVSYIPKRPGEPDCTWADIRKVERLLGWHPQKGFEEGISELLREDWRDAPAWTPTAIAEETKAWNQYLTPKSSA